MRLIDADTLLPMMKYETTDSEIGIFPIKIGFNAIAKVIDVAPTVEAIPVEFIKNEIRTNRGFYNSDLRKLLDAWEQRKEE